MIQISNKLTKMNDEMIVGALFISPRLPTIALRSHDLLSLLAHSFQDACISDKVGV